MKKLMIAASLLLILFAFASCNNANQALDEEVATTVAEELDPRTLVERVLRDDGKEGLDAVIDSGSMTLKKSLEGESSYTLSGTGIAVSLGGYDSIISFTDASLDMTADKISYPTEVSDLTVSIDGEAESSVDWESVLSFVDPQA